MATTTSFSVSSYHDSNTLCVGRGEFTCDTQFTNTIRSNGLFCYFEGLFGRVISKREAMRISVCGPRFFAKNIGHIDRVFASVKGKASNSGSAVHIEHTMMIRRIVYPSHGNASLVRVILCSVKGHIVMQINYLTILRMSIKVFHHTTSSKPIQVRHANTRYNRDFLISREFRFIMLRSFRFLCFVTYTRSIRRVSRERTTFGNHRINGTNGVRSFLCIQFDGRNATNNSHTRCILVISRGEGNIIYGNTNNSVRSTKGGFTNCFMRVQRRRGRSL